MEGFTLSDDFKFKDLITNFFATKPKEVDGIFNKSAHYYFDWCLSKIFGNFEIAGRDELWDINYIFRHLFIDGKFCITDTEYGVIPQRCSDTGYNIFDNPNEFIIATNLVNKHGVIGVDGAVIYLKHDHRGIVNMLNRYSYLLASCDSSISVNLMNSKVAFIGEAKDRAHAQTLKKLYDDIAMGKPAVFYNPDDDTNWTLFDVKNTYVANEILETREAIKNDFLCDIGINTYNKYKKERQIIDEVNANNQETVVNVENWIDTVNEGLQVANSLYGLNLEFRQKKIDQAVLSGGDQIEF